MTKNVAVSVKADAVKKALLLSLTEVVQFTVKVAAGEALTEEFQIPGLDNPKLLAIFTEGYEQTVDPVEVVVDDAVTPGYPIACSPCAILTADVDGGFSDLGVGTAPISLYFNNPGGSEVEVTILAGE